jgi:hypothetical protein
MKREALNAFAAEIMASAQASVAQVAPAGWPSTMTVEVRLALSIRDPSDGTLTRRETITSLPTTPLASPTGPGD